MTQAADLARVFGLVAEDYDRWRPSYPDQVIDWVVERCHGRRALEVGAGTGKATRAFVERGFEVVASDPDPAMVEVGRERVPGARWVVADALGLAVEPDLDPDFIYGAQVWHWIPRRADALLAASLRPFGVMAWMWNLPDVGESQKLFGDLFARFLPDVEEASRRRRRRRDSELWHDRLGEVTEAVEVFEHAWTRVMTAEGYVGMSGTFSDHVVLSDDRRRALMEAMAERIGSLGGAIELSYVTRVFLGHKAR